MWLELELTKLQASAITVYYFYIGLCWFMVFNAIFNKISVISWRSVLLMEETRRKPPTCRKSLKPLSHSVVSSTIRHELLALVAICTVCGGSYKCITTIRSRPFSFKISITCRRTDNDKCTFKYQHESLPVIDF